MSSYSRFSAILLVLMLSFLSIGRDSHETLLTAVNQGVEGEIPASNLSEKKLSDVFGLQQQYEHVVNAISSLPVPASKINPHDFLGGLFSVELRMRSAASLYLAQARKISSSLSVKVIIFPFHYFW